MESALDSVKPGDPNPTPIDQIPLDGCTFTWVSPLPQGTKFIAMCTRTKGHDGKQHVAEGDDTTGVLAVHPWAP